MKTGCEVISTSPPIKNSLLFRGPEMVGWNWPNPRKCWWFCRRQKKTLNCSPLKMGGWETILSFWGAAYFQRTVSYREGTCYTCLFFWLGLRSIISSEKNQVLVIDVSKNVLLVCQRTIYFLLHGFVRPKSILKRIPPQKKHLQPQKKHLDKLRHQWAPSLSIRRLANKNRDSWITLLGTEGTYPIPAGTFLSRWFSLSRFPGRYPTKKMAKKMTS